MEAKNGVSVNGSGVNPVGDTALVLDGAVVESDSASVSAQGVDEEHDQLVNTTLAGRYQVVRKIGEGGMADVYEVVQVSLGARRAVKVMKEKIAQDPTTRARFFQEAQFVGALNHPNIVKMLDVVEAANNRVAIVMELLGGTDLRGVLGDPPRQQPIRWSVWVALEVARAMIAAHEFGQNGIGIIHRDLKPENIFLATYSGGVRVVVMDFGVALLLDTHSEPERATRLTMAGSAVGTVRYVSPEQADDAKNVDGRTDVYALAGVLYEMLAGAPAFPGDSIISVLKAKSKLEQPTTMLGFRPDLPAELDALVLKSLNRDPNKRPATMRKFAAELEIIFQRLSDDPPMVAEDADAPVVSGAVPLTVVGSGSGAIVRKSPTSKSGQAIRGVISGKARRNWWKMVRLPALVVAMVALIIVGAVAFWGGNEKSLTTADTTVTAPVVAESVQTKSDAGQLAEGVKDKGKISAKPKLRKKSNAKRMVAPPAPATSGKPAELQAK